MYILPQTLGTNDSNEVVILCLYTIILMIPVEILAIGVIDVPYFGRKTSSLYAYIFGSVCLFICIFKYPDNNFVYIMGIAAGFT